MSEQPVTYREAHGIHKPTENGYCAALSVVCGRWPCDVVALIDERDALATQLAAERERSERLRGVLDWLVAAAEVYEARQEGATDSRVGLVQPITVAEGNELMAALRQARALLKEASDDTHA